MAVRVPAIALHGKFSPAYNAPVQVTRVTTDSRQSRQSSGTYFDPQSGELHILPDRPPVILSTELRHLSEGDIIRINPERGEIWVMYRISSDHNSILVTERCNSWCIMCSQPPRQEDDSGMLEDWFRAIPRMSRDTKELGITGGEPLLLGERFNSLIELCKQVLPETALHVLTNGRLFMEEKLVSQVKAIDHPDLMFGIPLYSDIAWRHDFVVQAPGAFDETMRGIMNLARARIPIEIRIVIHQHTIARLPNLARFISRNLPFVSKVAIMGMEPIGFGKSNFDALWIDPVDCAGELRDSIVTLSNARVPVLLYNFQLCVLPEEIRSFAVQSISDWKNIYLPICNSCDARSECVGFFHSAVNAHSRSITPIKKQTSID